MAKTPQIRTRALVPVDGRPVAVETLPPERRRALATALKARYLNELFCGRAAFVPAEDKKT